MIENLLLSLIGGGFALWVALGGVHLLRARLDFNPSGAFIADKITINGGVLAFTLGLSVCAALLFGLLPAFETSHLHPGGSLQEVDRTGSSGRRPSRLRSILVVVQISLALILLTCCAVVIKGLYDLDQLNAGFDPEQVITAGLQLSQGTYDSAAKQRAFIQASVQRIANLRGSHYELTHKPGAHGPLQHRRTAYNEAGGSPLGPVLRDHPGLSTRYEHRALEGQRIQVFR
jgi:hypothetical protein